MNNLPISSNSQPSGNALANAAANGAAVDAQSAEPFAFLLAQQIGASSPDAAQTALAIDGNATGGAEMPAKDAQEPPAPAGVTGDPANMLAAILTQLSAPKDQGLKTEGTATARPLALERAQKTEDSQAMQQSLAPVSSGETGFKASMPPPGSDTIIRIPASTHLTAEAINHTESPPSLPQPPHPAVAVVPAEIPAPPEASGNLPATPAVATRLGNNGWSDEFAQKITWMATRQNQVAELHLNPPDLGPLDVVLKISDNQATALFASPHGAVREAVENALPKLREILADNGIMLGNATVSDQPPRDRSLDGFMNQGSGAETQHRDAAFEPAAPEAMQSAIPARRHNGMVDTFA